LYAPKFISSSAKNIIIYRHKNVSYPTEEDKEHLMNVTGLSKKQITCWFSNNRKRYWKPKMDEMGKEANFMGNTLSEHAVEYLKNWLLSPEHIQNPYPTPQEKEQIVADTGIDNKQLICWFSNNRKRIWKVKINELKKLYGVSQEEDLSDEHWEMYARTSTAVAPTPLVAVLPQVINVEYPIVPPPNLNANLDAPVPPPDLHDIDFAAMAAAEVVESMSTQFEEEDDDGKKKKQKMSTYYEPEPYAV
jgi:hypothetical protein